MKMSTCKLFFVLVLMLKTVEVEIPSFHEWFFTKRTNQLILEKENFKTRKKKVCLTIKHDIKPPVYAKVLRGKYCL